MESIEVKIDVPWGIIAVVTQGDPKNQPIILTHGYSDNLNSFTELIKLLPKEFYYISVDLPSHGLSSDFPAHSIPNLLDFVVGMSALVKHFYTDRKFIFISHSLGGEIMMLVAQLYPEMVRAMVMIDSYGCRLTPTSQYTAMLRNKFDNYFRHYAKSTKPLHEYTYEKLLDKVIANRFTGDPLPEKVGRSLLKRMLIKNTETNLYRLRFDARILHGFRAMFDCRYMLDFLEKNALPCPILIIISKEGKKNYETDERIHDYYKRQKNCKIIHVDGNHDVHMIHPENIAPLINDFLLEKILSVKL